LHYSFASNLFVDRSLEDACTAIRAAGFAFVEVLADTPHAPLVKNPPPDIEGMRLAVERSGLRVSAVNANTVRCLASGSEKDFFAFRPSIHERDPNPRQVRVGYTRRAIDLCRALCAPVCVIATGPAPRDGNRSLDMSILSEILPELLDYADECGVTLAMEYEPGLLIGNAAELEKLLRLHDMLMCNLDIGHAAVCGEDPVSLVRRFGDKIANVHFEDIRGREHYHLPPSEGDIDLAGVIRELQAIDYNGAVTYELYSCQNRREEALLLAAAHMRSNLL
jgi:sugar phosphate isomerase/epimerase